MNLVKFDWGQGARSLCSEKHTGIFCFFLCASYRRRKKKTVSTPSRDVLYKVFYIVRIGILTAPGGMMFPAILRKVTSFYAIFALSNQSCSIVGPICPCRGVLLAYSPILRAINVVGATAEYVVFSEKIDLPSMLEILISDCDNSVPVTRQLLLIRLSPR